MNNKSFLSIKWKAAIFFGGLLLIFNASFPALVYWNLNNQFDFSRSQIQQQYQQQLFGQITDNSLQLQRLAQVTLIPEPNAPLPLFSSHIVNLIEKHNIELQLDWNVSQAQYFNASSQKQGGWGTDIPLAIKNLIPTVISKEQPLSTINCSHECKQYNLIPVLSQGKAQGVLLLSSSMSNIVVSFYNETHADLAILSNDANDHSSDNHHLNSWNKYISAVSSQDKNLPYLHSIMKKQTLADIMANGEIVRDKQLPSEFNFVTFDKDSDVLFIIIDDIALQRQEIKQITYRSIVISMLSVIILGSGIFYYLSAPLTRLSNVSRALPLLASQQFNTVRSIVPAENTTKNLDELDVLEHSTYDLSTQLESLQLAVKDRTKVINQRSSELQQERDFIKSLIDTAQVIILTLDNDYNISSFNKFAESSTGYSQDEVLHQPLSKFITSDDWESMEYNLTTLQADSPLHGQIQLDFLHANGSFHTISWLHSKFATPLTDTVILSVGLDITEQKRNEQQILWMAEHDALTGLYNRTKFTNEFTTILQQASESNQSGTLLFLDLDQFQDINVSCGHEIGDQLLKKIANGLTEVASDSNFVSRLGGDEFAIICPQSSSNEAIQLAETIAQQLAKIETIVNNVRYKITSSLGIIEFPLGNLTVNELIINADLAMYKAKGKGKNTWHQFSLNDEARLELEQRVLWKQKIEYALEHKQFIFVYQPIMDIRTRTVSHYEMLIRMRDDDGTIHPPATFIQVAEQTGLIHDIDHYVLQQGIEKIVELDQQDQGISLSINLSGHAIGDPFLLPLLKRLLATHNANPEHLIFELTETAAVVDISQARHLMTQLNDLGCRFSLDDFGTGFASFRYMRELPVDIVKIDGSFISNLATNPDDQLFVKALTDVAKGMGKKTVAEFVENRETLSLLLTFGVDYAQGYYIGKPEAEFLTAPPQLD
ncbi:diguanylate phosphodiesterase [Methylophaga sp. 41_12_T18]|nr:diguanylate phosphodiesterase [Methylophaga sp. 41_12_T18]